MRKGCRTVVCWLAACGMMAGTGRAAEVYFSDDFEAQQGSELAAPPAGETWRDVGTGANHAIAAAPVHGGEKSLQIVRGTDILPNLLGIGASGALVAGNTVEYVFHCYHGGGKVYEGAQVSLGAGPSSSEKIAGWVVTFDGKYSALDNGQPVVFDAKPSVNKWDRIRLVLSISNTIDSKITGTYDVFLTPDGRDEIQLGDDLALTAVKPYQGGTKPYVRIQRGPPSGISELYFDDISIQQAPEPAAKP